MGETLNCLKEENKDKIIIGLCLKAQFIQDLIQRDLSYFRDFIKENEEYFNFIDIHTLTEGINYFIGVLYKFTDVVYYDFDKDEEYLKYNKEYY